MDLKRYYQPGLLWVLAYNLAHSDPKEENRPAGDADLSVFIFRTDKPGAFLIRQAKIYWCDEPMVGDHFEKARPDALTGNAAVLGEVVIYVRSSRKTHLLATTFAQSVDVLTGRDKSVRELLSKTNSKGKNVESNSCHAEVSWPQAATR